MSKHQQKTLKKRKFNKFKPIKSKEVDADDENGFEKDQKTTKKWFEEVKDVPSTFPQLQDDEIARLRDEAKRCIDSEVANYNTKNSKSNSDYQWMKTVLSKGTVSDKIAAYTVLIQDNPLCNLTTLNNMVGMVKVAKKKECIAVIETLTELFLTDLLKPNSKLKQFNQFPLSLLNDLSSGNATTRRKYLSSWYFEHQLKEIYASYIQALNKAAHDSVDANKEKAISAMYALLVGNPEQENVLLPYIINKLGDPSQKISSKAIYCLSQVLYKHPNMKSVVVNEIRKFLFRPNLSGKAQYYSICFLSQLYLDHEETELAKNLITLYFSFFKACVKKGDVDSRMMSALLMGVNRAYPYAKVELANVEEHIDTMYRIVHMASFNVSLHALNLLFQVSSYSSTVKDRFYQALYKKLQDPQVGATTQQAMLLSLIFRALKADVNTARVRAFIKRLLQVSVNAQPPLACGLLYLISQLVQKNGNLFAVIVKPPLDDNDDDEEHYEDVKDTDEKLVTIKIEDEERGDSDVKTEEDVKPDVQALETDSKPVASWFHVGAKIKSERPPSNLCAYNPYVRNPIFAGGENCVYVELLLLKDHFHPTVSLFADKILNGESVVYQGDPLKDFTLIRFLDRFVFKNPKQIDADARRSASHLTHAKRKFYTAGGVKAMAVNSDDYVNEDETKIPVDEKFLYDFLQRKKKLVGIKREDQDSDNESVNSDEFESMLDKMGGKVDDDDDDNIDFMSEVNQGLKKSANDDDENDSQSDESDEDDQDFPDDDELDENEEGFEDVEDDDDASDIIFESDDDDETAHKNKKLKNDLSSIFASADDFADILDAEESGSSKDKINIKQLAWEKKRNWSSGIKKKDRKNGARPLKNKKRSIVNK